MQTQAAIDEGIGATMMFTDEWVDARQSNAGEGQSAQTCDSLPTLSIDSTELAEWSTLFHGGPERGQGHSAVDGSRHDG